MSSGSSAEFSLKKNDVFSSVISQSLLSFGVIAFDEEQYMCKIRVIFNREGTLWSNVITHKFTSHEDAKLPHCYCLTWLPEQMTYKLSVDKTAAYESEISKLHKWNTTRD